ncbi:hypothetical protein HMN09_00216600 [Mycena chlorophos]|uniref:Uncharacterized protein n=1 Tax=Mycena chlorophos TaxID=658473 RepID=A0A8H6WL78_MYCCL|nr:hypothetical protein HMN09_00216600 [Mycena chlorophos]
MPVTDAKRHITTRDVDTADTEPPSYAQMAPSISSNQSRPRPLPRVPALSLLSPQAGATAPLAPRRRVSGGSLSAPGRPKAPTFFVVNRNENDSPLSPATPAPFHTRLPLVVPLSPKALGKQPERGGNDPSFPDLSHLSLVMHTIPPTPRSPALFLHSPAMESPGFRARFSPARAKRNGRHAFGGSISSIPGDVLVQLRSLGEARTPDTPHMQDHDREAESESESSSESDEEDLEGELGYASDSELSMDPGGAKLRTSLRWVKDLDADDRWLAESYSDVLRAL